MNSPQTYKPNASFTALLPPKGGVVLITGESGTGKTWLSRHLHELSNKRSPIIHLDSHFDHDHDPPKIKGTIADLALKIRSASYKSTAYGAILEGVIPADYLAPLVAALRILNLSLKVVILSVSEIPRRALLLRRADKMVEEGRMQISQSIRKEALSQTPLSVKNTSHVKKFNELGLPVVVIANDGFTPSKSLWDGN